MDYSDACPFCGNYHINEYEENDCYQAFSSGNIKQEKQPSLHPIVPQVIQALLGLPALEGFEAGDKTAMFKFDGLRVNIEFIQ